MAENQFEKGINPRKPVKAIIQILHDNNIPIMFFDEVFENVKNDAMAHTIPYSPDVSKSN